MNIKKICLSIAGILLLFTFPGIPLHNREHPLSEASITYRLINRGNLEVTIQGTLGMHVDELGFPLTSKIEPTNIKTWSVDSKKNISVIVKELRRKTPFSGNPHLIVKYPPGVGKGFRFKIQYILRGPVTSIDENQRGKIHFSHKASFPIVEIILPHKFSYVKDSLKINSKNRSFNHHIDGFKSGQKIVITNIKGELFSFELAFTTKTGRLFVEVTDENGNPIRKFRKTPLRGFHGIPWWHWKHKIQTPEGDKIPGVQLWIQDLQTGQILDLNSAANEENAFRLPLGGTWTFSLPSGRYLVSAGTTVQIDGGDYQINGYVIEETTEMKYKGWNGSTPVSCGLRPALNGWRDEKGLFEIYDSKAVVSGNDRWKCIYYKRYTYNIANSTITYVGPNERDKAYVQLLRSPKLLSRISGYLAKGLLVVNKIGEKQLKEEYKHYHKDLITFSATEALTEETASTLLSKALVRLPRAGSSTFGPSMLASEATNLVFLTILDSEKEIDQEFLARFISGASISAGAWVASAKVGAVVGSCTSGPYGAAAGAAAGFAIGFVGDMVVDRIMEEYEKAKIREKVAKATFDDIKATIQYDANNGTKKVYIQMEAGIFREPEIISTICSCKGGISGCPVEVLSQGGKEQKLKAIDDIDDISFKIDGMPKNWREQTVDNYCLQGDIEILHGAKELDNLRWPLSKLLSYNPPKIGRK